MKKFLVLALFLAACGKTGSQGPAGANGTDAPVDASINSVWVSTDTGSRIPSLNFTSLQTDVLGQDITPVIDCLGLLAGGNDESGNSAAVNGAAKNQFSVTGSAQNGLIQFGPLSHANQNLDNVCYTIGQEEYSYVINGNQLTLCDTKYFACGTYLKQ